MTPFNTTAIVDTDGWDMVIGLPLPVVNNALKNVASSLDLAFSYTAPNAGQTIELSGTFAPWSISSGAGQDLTLSVPIAAGTCRVTGKATGPFALTEGTFDLGGLSVTVGTRLAFRSAPNGQSGSQLVFAFDAAMSTIASGPAVPTAGSLSGGASLPSSVQALVPDAIASCLAANVTKMNLVFATLTETMGGIANRTTAGNTPEWQYAVASQQGSSSQTLAIFYAARPQGDLTANIPEAIGSIGDQCTVVLSRKVAVETAIVPALVYGFDHASAPMPPGFGVGPFIVHAPPASNDIDPNVFTVTVNSGETEMATIRISQPLTIALGGYSGGQTATLTQFDCTLVGSAIEVSAAACLSSDPATRYTSSSLYTIVIGQQDQFGQSAFGVAMFPDEQVGQSQQSVVSRMIFESIERGLVLDPLPFSFALFGNQQMSPEQGYLNGGLALAGPIMTSADLALPPST